jgi:hypothetical protein
MPLFAVGHLALGYIFGKAASKALKVDLNIPLLLAVSVMPDIDFLIPHLEHRGPVHSLILIFFLFLPAFLCYKGKVVPYFLALIQHPFLGDFFTGEGVQLFWPLTFHWYGIGMEIVSLANILVEWTLFLAFLVVMFRAKDLQILLQHHTSNMLLAIPVFAILLPVAFDFPLSVPMELVIPHLIYLTLFTLSILIDFQFTIKKFFGKSAKIV